MTNEVVNEVVNEVPKNEVPKNEVPKNEVPKNEVPKNEVPKNEVPKNEVVNKVVEYTTKTVSELKQICRDRKIKGFSGKTSAELIALIQSAVPVGSLSPLDSVGSLSPLDSVGSLSPLDSVGSLSPLHQEIIHADTLHVLPTLASESAQIIIADPPYNIGKDFGNDSDKQSMDEYLKWCDKWMSECYRILKPNGTMFIYGFSEILALLLARVPHHINRRWIIWHYTNKNVPSLNFWQRSHESIIVLWKSDKVFHRDEIREAYTEGFLNGAAGKERKATKGRFSKGDKTTTYTAHANGALPRDVIKVAALAGGAGMNERVNHPTQKPLALCDKLLRSCMQSAADGYVLVPFAGSGSECVAAKKIGLPFIGIEINPDYVALIRERLEVAPLGL